jgi:hypothetical protein
MVFWLILSCKDGRGKKRYIIPSVYGGLMVLSISFNLIGLLDILALLSVPLIASLLILDRFFLTDHKKFFRPPISSLSINYLAAIGIILGIISLIITILTPVYTASPVPSPISILGVPNYAHGLIALFSSFSPILIFLFTFCVPLKLLLNELSTRIPKLRLATNSSLFFEKKNTKVLIVLLSLSMLLSIAIAIIPHEAVINKTNRLVGTDTHYYIGWQKNLTQSRDIQQFLEEAFLKISAGDRPASVLFIFAIVNSIPLDPVLVIDNLSLILAPVLVVVVFFLTRELTSNDMASILSAFLTAISSQTLIGIYAGFYANWIALIIGYLLFVFLIRYLKVRGRVNIVVYSLLVVLLLFSHVTTWTIFTIVVTIFLMVMLKLSYYSRRSIILLLLIVLSTIVVDVVRGSSIKIVGGIEEDIAVSNIYGAGLGQFAYRWSNLVYTTQVYLAGLFSNPIILILGLYWLYHSKLSDQSSIFLLIFLSLGVIPLFIGSIVIQARVFFDIPFQIPAAIALTYMRKHSSGGLFLFCIGILLVAASVNAASNFYFVPGNTSQGVL